MRLQNIIILLSSSIYRMSVLYVIAFFLIILDNQAWGDKGIIAALINAYPKDGLVDLSSLRESLKKIPFAKFQERASDDLEVGLSLDDFKTRVGRLTTDFGLNDGVKQSILEGQYAEVNKEVIKRFEFRRGQSGEVIQGLAATRKRQDGTIDFGHVIHRLDFQLSPEVIQHKKKRRRWFRTRTRTWYEARSRTLSHKDEVLLVNYVQRKLVDGIDHLKSKALTLLPSAVPKSGQKSNNFRRATRKS